MTKEYARDLWLRAVNALKSARVLIDISPDDAASRAYYAVFNAVSAYFAWEGKSFVKHAAVRASVHKELVNTGLWSRSLGESFDLLWELRDVGDYGGDEHVQEKEATQALKSAEAIVDALLHMNPELKSQ